MSGVGMRQFTLLVCNCGSSSLSCQVYKGAWDGKTHKGLTSTVSCKAHRVGTKSTEPSFIEYNLHGWAAPDGRTKLRDESMPVIATHAVAIEAMLKQLTALGVHIDAVGHRFVHGGALFPDNAAVTPEVHSKLVQCLPLATIHNPNSLSVIDFCDAFFREQQRAVVQYVVFDTAFHKLAPEAYTYAISRAVAEEQGYRKFGFHGLSYQFLTEALAAHGVTSSGCRRVVACHLGTGGSSAAAIRDGVTVDTTMGWSPVPGLVMSTRSGDIDPSVVLDLVDRGWSTEQVKRLLNNQSGLVGLTGGVTSDLRDVHRLAHEDGPAQAVCALAYGVYVHRLVGAIGALVAVMGGVDALVFTDDLGFNMPALRQSVCERLAWLGVALDERANASTTKGAGLLADTDVALLSAPESRVRVYAVVNDEEIIVAREVFRFLPQ